MAKKVYTEEEQRELDILDELDTIDILLQTVRNSNVKAEVEEAVREVLVSLQSLLTLRKYPPLLQEVEQ